MQHKQVTTGSRHRMIMGLALFGALFAGSFAYRQLSLAEYSQAATQAASWHNAQDGFITARGRMNALLQGLSKIETAAPTDLDRRAEELRAAWGHFASSPEARNAELATPVANLSRTIEDLLLVDSQSEAVLQGSDISSRDKIAAAAPQMQSGVDGDFRNVDQLLNSQSDAADQKRQTAFQHASYSGSIAAGSFASLCALLLLAVARVGVRRWERLPKGTEKAAIDSLAGVKLS